MPAIKAFPDLAALSGGGASGNIYYVFPDDADSFDALRDISVSGSFRFRLFGDKKYISGMCRESGIDADISEIFDHKDPSEAASRAASQAAADPAAVLVKGDVNSSIFMRAVLERSSGITHDKRLSHLSAFEIPGMGRLIFMSDGGLNIAPTLGEKADIIRNAAEYLRGLGYRMPRVAVLTANELVSEKMPATLDAASLAQMAADGRLTGVAVAGPMSLDAAIDPAAAAHKDISGPVAGNADILIVPDIEAGNILGKSIIYFARGVMAGIVLGASVPIVLTSRASSSLTKSASIWMALLDRKAGSPERPML